MRDTTKQRLIDIGLTLLLRHGYNDLGVQALLKTAGVPKGSFYHHFESKEDFVLQVIDRYMVEVHHGLDTSLGDRSLAPLDRVRRFFEMTSEKYRSDGYMGCMLGGLGQELSGVNETFRHRIEACFGQIAGRIADCLAEARQTGDLPPGADPQLLSNLIVNCWEGAALRSRLRHDASPLDTMLDFYFGAVAVSAAASARPAG